MELLRGGGRKSGSSASLGLKKGPTKRTKKKGVTLSKLVNYLMSDSYMYSHLLDASSESSSAVTGSPLLASSAAGGGLVSVNEASKMKLKERLWEYLKSDSLLYSSKEESPPPGPRLQFKHVNRQVLLTDISTRNSLTEESQDPGGGRAKVISIDGDLRKHTLKRQKVNGKAY